MLYRGGKFIPLHTLHTVSLLESTNAVWGVNAMSGVHQPHPTGGRKNASQDFTALNTPKPVAQIETVKSKVAVLLQILMVEDKKLYSGSKLVSTLTFLDGSIITVDDIPVEMSSAGLVDEEAAQQFAANLVDMLYLEKMKGEEKLTLKISSY
jgi:hypothetical protein